jgi:hypothetical protein
MIEVPDYEDAEEGPVDDTQKKDSSEIKYVYIYKHDIKETTFETVENQKEIYSQTHDP